MSENRAETVLVVDDEEIVRRFVALCLRRHGYRVIEAEDGRKGLVYFQKHRREIDVILTDVMMPNMDGPEMARVILKHDPAARIIFMSGTAGLSDLPKQAVKGFQILHKPFTAERLTRSLRQRLAECG